MPAPAPSIGVPSLTNASAKISTHETAKNRVVVQNLAALQFDGEVLSQHERGDFGECHAPPTVER